MPTRTKGRPTEEITLENKKFVSGNDVREALRVPDVAQLTANLLTLRNQWTIRHDESSPISANDERLNVAKNYLANSPSANEIFNAWELLSRQSITHQHLALGVFSSLLTLLSTQYIYHPLGLPVLRALLAPTSSRKLNAYLNSAQTGLVLSALKLWNVMAEYAGAAEKRRVYEEFAWGNKSLFRLFNMRRKGKTDISVSPFISPDIRTLYITFILQFVQRMSNLQFIKAAFLESHSEVFLGIFKRLHEDPYLLVRMVLEASWEGIWQDNRLKKTLKIGLFSEKTLALLIKLYSRAAAETSDQESIPADLVHHFLLALCTRPGTGLCFKDNGWYPRQEDDEHPGMGDEIDDPDNYRTGDGKARDRVGKTYNRIIGNFLKNLRPTDDARHQELVMKIFQACPELVHGYWSSSSLTVEPRLSSKWLINVAWIGGIISLKVPSSSFYLPNADAILSTTTDTPARREYNPTPPPLTIVLSNILPSLWSKTLITKGLQHASPLVQRATALCLAQVLEKYELVLCAFRQVEDALEEEGEGRWKTRRQEVEREIKKKVPNFEVVVAFSQVTSAVDSHGGTIGSTELDKVLKSAMMSECALRLMWLYHRSLPELPAEARYDVGKLLLSKSARRLVDALSRDATSISATRELMHNVIGFDTLTQLHVLRLLRHSDQFIWHTTLGETNQTHLYHLLHLYVLPLPTVLSKHCADLIQSVLSQSVLFEHDPLELPLWLEALPRRIRAPDAKGPNDEELVNERETMIAVLDKCMRYCVKSPWKYMERAVDLYMEASTDSATDGEGPEGYNPSSSASPLLMTMLEFFEGVLRGEPALPPSAALSIATYLRRLLLGISLKQSNSHYALRAVSILQHMVAGNNTAATGESKYSMKMMKGIRREVSMLRDTLLRMGAPQDTVAMDDEGVIIFLNRVENLVVDEGKGALTAYSIIDWIRHGGHRMTPASALRLIKAVEKWYPPALVEVIDQIDPSRTPMASLLQADGYMEHIPFTWAYLHATNEDLLNEQVLEELSRNIAREPAFSTRGICGILLRRLESSIHPKLNETIVTYTCTLWAKGYSKIQDPQIRRIHFHIAIEAPCMQSILHADDLSSDTNKAISYFVDAFLDPLDQAGCFASRSLCEYWLTKAQNAKKVVPPLRSWTPFMTTDELEQTLELLNGVINEGDMGEETISMLHFVLRTLQRSLLNDAEFISKLLLRLIALWQVLPNDDILCKFISALMASFVAFGVGKAPTSAGFACEWAGTVEKRWKLARKLLLNSIIEEVLRSTINDEKFGAVEILSPCLYKSAFTRRRLATMLLGKASTSRESVTSFQYLLDASTSEDEYLPRLCTHFSSTIIKRALYSHRGKKEAYEKTLKQLFKLSNGRRELFLMFSQQYLRVEEASSVLVLENLVRSDCLDPSEVGTLLSGSFKRLMSFIGADKTAEEISPVMDAIGYLAKKCSTKLDVDDTFFIACAGDHLANVSVMQTFSLLVPLSNMKPATSNRLIQTILHHAQFDRVALSTSRDALIAALYSVFCTHPQNTCQPSHVFPLISVYRGTLSPPDLQLLAIFRLFEQNRKHSCSAIISQWTPTPEIPQTNILDSIIGLDANISFATCIDFPQWRTAYPDPSSAPVIETQKALYDPLFIVLLLGLVVQADGTDISISGMNWVQIFRSNTVCVLISCLSSRQDSLRTLAWNVFGGLLVAIRGSEFQEQAQTVYMLNMLSRLYGSTASKDVNGDKPDGPRTSDRPPRLPCFTTLFFVHAIRALYQPASILYPLTSRFLLQRPDFDPMDPPMLYSMLYSSLERDFRSKEGNWKRERSWMLRFLADGMVGSKDWAVLQRRHTWDLLATMFQSTRDDKSMALAISKVILKISLNQRAATSLVCRSNLFPWLEIQIQQKGPAISDEAITEMWFRIVENLLITMNYERVEGRRNGGTWRGHCIRCLEGLLHLMCTDTLERSAMVSVNCLASASRILFRIADRSSPAESLARGLQACMDALRHVEKRLVIGSSEILTRTWAETQIRLWQVMMKGKGKDGDIAWYFDILTARVVALNGFPFKTFEVEMAHAIEWARRQTLLMYNSGSDL